MSDDELNYFLIFDFSLKKEIGSYSTKNLKISMNKFTEIQKKCKDILNEDININNKSKKNKIIQKNFAFCHTLTKDNTFLIAVFLKNSKYVNTNAVFEFFEDIDHQSLIKFVDKNGQLNNVGKQNLLYTIEKYFSKDSKNLNSDLTGDSNNNSLLYGNSGNDKILQVNSDVKDIQTEMKNGIKKLVNNVESVRELENRAEKINSSSMNFKKDAETLRKNIQMRNLRLKIIMFSIALVVCGFFIYQLIS